MKIRSWGYNIRQGFKNIYRNRLFSLASVATIGACIFLFGVFFSIIVNFQHMLEETEKNICVTVFFDKGITEERIKEIGEEVSKRTEVDSIHFTSAEEAWESFKYDYFKDYEELAEGFKNDNPLVNSASYEIYLNDASMQSSLVAYLEGLDGIRTVNRSEITAHSLADMAILLGYVSVVIIAILLAVSIFLINNTITVGVTVRKEEISIMKLIGATDLFVKAPFIVEGITIGLVGAAIPLAIIYFAYEGAVNYITTSFSIFGGGNMFLSVTDVFSTLIPVALGLGVGIGFLGSYFSLRKHVKI